MLPSTPQSNRTPVASSSIASIGYSDEASLDVEFRSGAVYRYFAVPKLTFEAFLAVDSKGAFFNEHIKGRYPYVRV